MSNWEGKDSIKDEIDRVGDIRPSKDISVIVGGNCQIVAFGARQRL